MAVACVASFTSAALGVGSTIVTFAPDALVLAIVSDYLEMPCKSHWNHTNLQTSTVALDNSTSALAETLSAKKDIKSELTKRGREETQLLMQLNIAVRCRALLHCTGSDLKALAPKIHSVVNIWQTVGITQLRNQVVLCSCNTNSMPILAQK